MAAVTTFHQTSAFFCSNSLSISLSSHVSLLLKATALEAGRVGADCLLQCRPCFLPGVHVFSFFHRRRKRAQNASSALREPVGGELCGCFRIEFDRYFCVVSILSCLFLPACAFRKQDVVEECCCWGGMEDVSLCYASNSSSQQAVLRKRARCSVAGRV